MKELKVQPIRNGTVIDHITAGRALTVLRILGVPRAGHTSPITAAMNVPSEASPQGRKDIVKIEDRELDANEVSKIALVSPRATINIVREYEVARKENVRLPEKVSGILKCPNPNCITNHEPIKTQFLVASQDPVHLQCGYCDREIDDVAAHIA